MTSQRRDVSSTLSKMSGNMRGTATQLMMKNRDDEFVKMIEFNNEFQTKIKTLSTIGDNVAQDRCLLLDDNSEYATAFRLWANSETKLADTLNAISEGVD